MRPLSLRGKLALVALVALVLPLTGWRYVREMERFLLAEQREALASMARAVATALHERPQLLAYRPAAESDLRREAEAELQRLARGVGSPREPADVSAPGEPPANGTGGREIAAILQAVERSSSRIWVVSRDYRLLALAGSLKHPEVSQPSVAQWLIGWFIEQPSEDFDEGIADEALAAGREIAAALQGAAGTRTRNTRDGRAVVVSAAHPIWVGDQVHGAVVVEETTNRIAALRNEALAQLLATTLASFVLVALVLVWFASRVSSRIRRLRDEAEAAIDARGRVARLLPGSEAGDEIGDLARSFTTVLERLARYNAYLEGLAGRLSHELRTPLAVVRSSLENLRVAGSAEDVQTYVARAEAGLARLSRILERMTEASRLEQSLTSAERERYDAVPVVKGCVEGYRLAYPQAAFALSVPEPPVMLEGSADLLAQLLDKLVENAVEFSVAGKPVRIALAKEGDEAALTVENLGPLLPKSVRGQLFESMVSARSERSPAIPHLGLGLYVARLIAEFHRGAIRAEDLPSGDGVAFKARFPLGRSV